MPNLTTNYSFNLPLVNDATDQDLWGGYLNANWSSIDTLLFTATNLQTSAKTGAYTVTTSDRNKLITGDATSAGFTITLPAAATAGDGFKVSFKKIDSSANAVTIDGDGSETIDGATTYVLSTQYQSVTVVSDGSNWLTVNDTALPAASDTVAGVIEIATASEMAAASSATLAATPARMTDHWGVAKGLLRASGAGTATSSKGNISSVSRTSTGTYQVTLSAAMSEIYCQVSVTTGDASRTNAVTIEYVVNSSTQITVYVNRYSSGPYNPTEWTLAVFGVNS